jgi:malate/lactate dehydrogenase
MKIQKIRMLLLVTAGVPRKPGHDKRRLAWNKLKNYKAGR